MNLIVAHLGGGITTSLHAGGRIIDMVLDDEGAFSPERAGGLPNFMLLKHVFDNGLTYAEAMKQLQRRGGLMSHFGTADVRVVQQQAVAGNQQAALVLEAMALSIAQGIARLAVDVNGQVDAIILTGGIAHSAYFTDQIRQRVTFIAPLTIIPGENEMQALAEGRGGACCVERKQPQCTEREPEKLLRIGSTSIIQRLPGHQAVFFLFRHAMDTIIDQESNKNLT